jgi:hypothetical protein
MGWASCGGVGRCRMRLHACFGRCVTVGVIGWIRRPNEETDSTAPGEQHGALLKEYVAVPADLLERLPS